MFREIKEKLLISEIILGAVYITIEGQHLYFILLIDYMKEK